MKAQSVYIGNTIIKIICVIAPITIITLGCSDQGKVEHHLELIESIDTSRGCAARLPAFAALASQLAGQLDADDFVSAYRMDYETRCFYDSNAPESQDQFQETLVHELGPPAERRGTYPAKLFSALAARAEASKEDVEICVATDGDNDDGSRGSEAALRSAASRLASNPRVRAVALVGVARENWGRLAADFQKMGIRRFRIFGRTQVTADEVGRFLDDARSSDTKEDGHG